MSAESGKGFTVQRVTAASDVYAFTMTVVEVCVYALASFVSLEYLI